MAGITPPRANTYPIVRPVFWLVFVLSRHLPAHLAQWQITEIVGLTAAGAAPDCLVHAMNRVTGFPFHLCSRLWAKAPDEEIVYLREGAYKPKSKTTSCGEDRLIAKALPKKMRALTLSGSLQR